MVDHQLGNHFQAPLVGILEKCPEIIDRPVIGIDLHVVCDIVTIVTKRGRIKRQQPYRRDTETFKVGQFPAQSLEITDTIIVAVKKGFDVSFVDNGVFVPFWLRLVNVAFCRHKTPKKNYG